MSVSAVILNWNRPRWLRRVILPILSRHPLVSEIQISHGREDTSFSFKSRRCDVIHRHDWKLNARHYLNRDFEKALDYARQVQALAPDYHESYVLLAAASAQLGREEEAAKYIARILEMFPEYPSFAWTFWQIWFHDHEHRNLLAEGLRKAGLDIPDEPAAAD